MGPVENAASWELVRVPTGHWVHHLSAGPSTDLQGFPPVREQQTPERPRLAQAGLADPEASEERGARGSAAAQPRRKDGC